MQLFIVRLFQKKCPRNIYIHMYIVYFSSLIYQNNNIIWSGFPPTSGQIPPTSGKFHIDSHRGYTHTTSLLLQVTGGGVMLSAGVVLAVVPRNSSMAVQISPFCEKYDADANDLKKGYI